MSRIGADEQVTKCLRNWRWWVALPALSVLWIVVRSASVAEVAAERAGEWIWQAVWKESRHD